MRLRSQKSTIRTTSRLLTTAALRPPSILGAGDKTFDSRIGGTGVFDGPPLFPPNTNISNHLYTMGFQGNVEPVINKGKVKMYHKIS